MNDRHYYLLEHLSYGVLMEWDNTYYDIRPKFSYLANRSEGIHYYTLGDAQAALQKCRRSGRRGMAGVYILERTEKGYKAID